MSNLTNKERICQIANALKELNDDVVYVGGAVIQFYSSDPAAINPITTTDVDCVVDVNSYSEYITFIEKIYSLSFSNDTSEGAPICRYLYNGEKVDFMPKVDTGIGESNRWYLSGLKEKRGFRLDANTIIYLLPIPYYLATKLEALHSRGGSDYRGEKDFEDIVFVLNIGNSLLEDIHLLENQELTDYLKKEFSAFLIRPNIREEIESALLEPDRLNVVLAKMREIVYG